LSIGAHDRRAITPALNPAMRRCATMWRAPIGGFMTDSRWPGSIVSSQLLRGTPAAVSLWGQHHATANRFAAIGPGGCQVRPLIEPRSKKKINKK
jgi:hypothetical protein